LEGRITVVDNASTDGTDELIRKHYPFVHHILNDQNIGLSKSLNIGIKEGLDCDFTLLLNDDIELYPDTVSLMLQTLVIFPDAKGIPAGLKYPDGRPQRVKLKIIGVEKKNRGASQYIEFGGTTACLYHTDVFEKIGLFDEFYFFYNEDLDFSLRAKRNGIKFVFNPDIKVIHHRKQGRRKAAHAIRPYYYATNYYFYRKNYGLLFALVYLLLARFNIGIRRRQFTRDNENEKLLLLKKGKEKLKDTVRNFNKLRSGARAV
jgi:GT2 family glycosyltransferase